MSRATVTTCDRCGQQTTTESPRGWLKGQWLADARPRADCAKRATRAGEVSSPAAGNTGEAVCGRPASEVMRGDTNRGPGDEPSSEVAGEVHTQSGDPS